MQNSAVSGALTYRELCMAARNEEQWKAEMRRRKQYRGTVPTDVSDPKKTEGKSEGRPRSSTTKQGGSSSNKQPPHTEHY